MTGANLIEKEKKEDGLNRSQTQPASGWAEIRKSSAWPAQGQIVSWGTASESPAWPAQVASQSPAWPAQDQIVGWGAASQIQVLSAPKLDPAQEEERSKKE